MSFEQVRSEVKRHTSEVQSCYDSALAQRPCAGGTLTLRFWVQPGGTVSSSRADDAPGISWDLAACVEQYSMSWRFPSPSRELKVIYPFVLSPVRQPNAELSCGARLLDRGSCGRAQLPVDLASSGWQAICRDKKGADVRPVRLSLAPFRDEMAGDKPGEKTGRRIVVSGCDRSLALIRGVYGVAPGKVSTAKITTTGTGEARRTEISLGDVKYRLRFEGRDTGLWRLVLEGRGGVNALMSWTDDPPTDWKVRWAGDLDGDLRPDFLLEEHREAGALHLFTSRAAPPGRDVGEVADTAWGGC